MATMVPKKATTVPMPLIKVTFDTNVFSHIVRPEGCNDAALKEVCIKIADEISRGNILPHVSETVFSLEGIQIKDRSNYFGNYRPSSKIELVPSDKPGFLQFRLTLGPNQEGRPESNPILLEKIRIARAMGFKMLSTPRIALPKSPDLTDSDFGSRTSEEMGTQQELYFEVGRFIDSLGAGFMAAKAIGDKHRTTEDVWYEALKHSSKNDAKNSIGEWADGDTIATHISYRLDYFCTRDEAKSAGPKSVFSPKNRAALTERFNVKFVTPEELLGVLPET